MSADLVVVVHGIPAPQGSKRHVGAGVMVESSAKVKPWRAVVTLAAAAAATEQGWEVDPKGAVSVHAVFTLARPRSHYRAGANSHLLAKSAPSSPATRPDLDKLVRSTLDALTDAGVLADDSRVTILIAAKVYPGGALDALETPGAVLTIVAGSC